MGDFDPVAAPQVPCMCGHDLVDHPDGPCEVFEDDPDNDAVFVAGVPCGCQWFEDADVDADYVPGLDDA